MFLFTNKHHTPFALKFATLILVCSGWFDTLFIWKIDPTQSYLSLLNGYTGDDFVIESPFEWLFLIMFNIKEHYPKRVLFHYASSCNLFSYWLSKSHWSLSSMSFKLVRNWYITYFVQWFSCMCKPDHEGRSKGLPPRAQAKNVKIWFWNEPIMKDEKNKVLMSY